MEKWKFETEEKDYSFIIEVDDHEEPFDVAYDSYGPQVHDMYYQKLKPDYKMYDEITEEFVKYMKKELELNYLKGDRNGENGWLNVRDNKYWISELYYHVGKLQSAIINGEANRIKENCADIANIAMMTLDVNINLLKNKIDE